MTRGFILFITQSEGAKKKKSKRVAASLDNSMIIRGAGSLMRREGDCVRTPRTGKVGKSALIPSGYPSGLSVRWASFDTSGHEGFVVNKAAEGIKLSLSSIKSHRAPHTKM